MRLISVECLPGALRAAILKSLHAAFPLATADTERDAHPLALLLHRLQAASKCGGADVLLAGCWRAAAYRRPPELARLHRDLAHELTRVLGLVDVRHLLVVVHVDVHEAFEHALENDDARDVSLQSLRHLAAALDDPEPRSPFDARIVRVHAPPYAADNPVTLARVLREIRERVTEWISAP